MHTYHPAGVETYSDTNPESTALYPQPGQDNAQPNTLHPYLQGQNIYLEAPTANPTKPSTHKEKSTPNPTRCIPSQRATQCQEPLTPSPAQPSTSHPQENTNPELFSSNLRETNPQTKQPEQPTCRNYNARRHQPYPVHSWPTGTTRRGETNHATQNYNHKEKPGPEPKTQNPCHQPDVHRIARMHQPWHPLLNQPHTFDPQTLFHPMPKVVEEPTPTPNPTQPRANSVFGSLCPRMVLEVATCNLMAICRNSMPKGLPIANRSLMVQDNTWFS